MTLVAASAPATIAVTALPRHRARRLSIDTGQEAVVYLHRNSEVCRAEGFQSETRVWVRVGTQAILATLNVVTGDLLAIDQTGLSEVAWRASTPLERQGHTVSSLQRDWQKRSCSPVIMRQRPRSW